MIDESRIYDLCFRQIDDALIVKDIIPQCTPLEMPPYEDIYDDTYFWFLENLDLNLIKEFSSMVLGCQVLQEMDYHHEFVKHKEVIDEAPDSVINMCWQILGVQQVQDQLTAN